MYPIREEGVKAVLVNKVLGLKDLEPRDATIRKEDLDLVALDVPVPELIPHEYIYCNVYTDGELYYATLNERFSRKSSVARFEAALKAQAA